MEKKRPRGWFSRREWIKRKMAVEEREKLERQGQLRLFPLTGMSTEPVGYRRPAWEE